MEGRYACLFYFCTLPTDIYQTELFNPRNPYDTDLPVISDARELSYFSFFVFVLFGARRVDFFLLVDFVVGILSRDV